MREVNRRFLVNEHGDLSIFSLFLSPVNASFLYREYKQISIVETLVINGNVNFAAISEDKFVASRTLYVWNKFNRCRAFVLFKVLEVDAVLLLIIPRFASYSLFFFCPRETLIERFK